MNKLMLIFYLAALPLSAAAGEPETFRPEALAPSYIPVDRPALPELTASLRLKVKTLGLNGKNNISRTLLLLPRDRAGAGVLSFEIEGGPRAGLYQCEALGRGLTYGEPGPGLAEGFIDGATIYYAPADMSGGATIPGVYDLRNISPLRYDIVFLNKPYEGLEARTAPPAKLSGRARFFSAVWSHWYPKSSPSLPVDMIWAGDSQAGSQGAGVPVFERPSGATVPEKIARRQRQLEADPGYYRGPHGRYGFAVHTDSWEEPERLADKKYAGRPEAKDFRWRDTNGCVKLRPACLELLNEFISGQERKGRRVQLEVYETPLLDGLPVSE